MRGCSSPFEQVGGLLLAGGRSSRFGSDKAFARLKSQLLIDLAARPLACLPVYAISARIDSAAADHAHKQGLAILADDPSLPTGPLAGVLAGLDWARELGLSHLATVPCDAPFLPSDLFTALLCGIGEANAAYARTPKSDHPLCALWRVSLRDPLRAALAQGRHPSVRSLLARVGAVGVGFEDERAFANANTREALASLEPLA